MQELLRLLEPVVAVVALLHGFFSASLISLPPNTQLPAPPAELDGIPLIVVAVMALVSVPFVYLLVKVLLRWGDPWMVALARLMLIYLPCYAAGMTAALLLWLVGLLDVSHAGLIAMFVVTNLLAAAAGWSAYNAGQKSRSLQKARNA